MNPRLLGLLRGAREAELRHDWDLAAWLYGITVQLEPANHRLTTNLGNVLWLADKPQQAESVVRRAVQLAPAEALPYRGLGNVLRDLNDFEQASEAYGQALSCDGAPLTAWNLSQCLIGLERYDAAYAVAEARLSVAEMLPYRDPPYFEPDVPLQALVQQRNVRLWSEQGFGDTLQYVRWVCGLCQQPHQLTLEVEWQLLTLLQQGLAWLPYPPTVVAKPRSGEPEPLKDALQGPLMSLPHHMGGAPLALRQGYLRSPLWPRAGSSPVQRIGLAWAAGRKLDDPFTAREYRKRSLPLAALEQLIEALLGLGAELVNLQIGPDRSESAGMAHCFVDSLAETADFAATAALVLQLNLVICVDTALAHLVGALGHPGWVLLPFSADPRWLRQRSDCVWYPSLRLWRQQSRGDWRAPIDALTAELSDRLNRGSGW